MKLFSYIWRNARRNKLRTILTILSVGFSLSLMTLLYGFLATQDAWKDEAEQHNRFVTMSSSGFAGVTPIAYVERIRAMDGVVAAVPYSWFGGTYKDDPMPFAQFATDPQYAFDVWSEYKIDPDQLAAWKSNRRGCVVDRRLAQRRGWTLGERIPLKGTFYPFNLDLELVGIFDTPQPVDSLWFNWTYLDEGLKSTAPDSSGNAGTVFAKATSAAVIPELAKTIDDRFASSDNPTRTQTEAAFAQMFTDMVGNIRALIRNIGIAVMFSLTLVAANAMAMSLRERTTEIAVLKAIGFQRGRILTMILGESCIIACIGGLFGLIGGGLCLELANQAAPTMFPFGIADLVGPWMLWVLMMAVMIGLISGIVPAKRAADLPVIDGLRRVV